MKRPNTGQEAIHWVFSLPELAVWFKAVLHLPEIITIIAIVIMVTTDQHLMCQGGRIVVESLQLFWQIDPVPANANPDC